MSTIDTPTLWRTYLTNQGYTFNDIQTGLAKALQSETGLTTWDITSLWNSYLTAQGYTTGDLSTRLYNFLGDKGYTGTLQDRWNKALLAEDVFAAAAYDYAALFTGGYTGFVYDGSASSFYDADTGGNLVSSDGDAVGYIEDLSGGGNHAIQDTATERPVLYVDGAGIKSWRIGKITQGRWMTFTNSTTTPAQFTTIVVAAPVQFNANNGTYPMCNFVNGSWTNSTYHAWGAMIGTPSQHNGSMNDSPGWTSLSSNMSISPKRAATLLWERTGTGANQFEMTNYTMAGAQNNTTTFTATSTVTPTLIMGAGIAATVIDQIDLCFMFHINRNLTAQERTDVLDYITTTFGSWGPEV